MITRDFLSALTYRVMNDSELQAFAGCESPVPLIADTWEYVVIIDGDRCEVLGDEGIIDTCDSISNLSR